MDKEATARSAFARVPMLNLGREGETHARRYLEENGYKVVKVNYRCPIGEIDLICRDGITLVFVEVKARNTTEKGLPEEAVTPYKQKQLVRLASWFLSEIDYADNFPVRFDVVSVLYESGKGEPNITLFRDAICF